MTHEDAVQMLETAGVTESSLNEEVQAAVDEDSRVPLFTVPPELGGRVFAWIVESLVDEEDEDGEEW